MSKKDQMTINKLLAILQELQKRSGSPSQEKEQWTVEALYGKLIIRSALGEWVGVISFRYEDFIPTVITMYEGKEI